METQGNGKVLSRQMTKEILMKQAHDFLATRPEVTKHLTRHQRRKVAGDLVKRLLKETREHDSL